MTIDATAIEQSLLRANVSEVSPNFLDCFLNALLEEIKLEVERKQKPLNKLFTDIVPTAPYVHGGLFCVARETKKMFPF